MSTYRQEERALEAMRKELAAEPVPELPWNQMERELLAKLDEAPMTSHPRSLDARVDDVPIMSMRHSKQRRFAGVAAVFLAAAAFPLIFWSSPLRRGESIVISTSSPRVSSPGSSEQIVPDVPRVETSNPASSASVEAPPAPMPELTIEATKEALGKCLAADKPGKRAPKEPGKLIISLEADGQVSKILFDPPLAPSVMQCVFDSLRPGKFVETTESITIPF